MKGLGFDPPYLHSFKAVAVAQGMMLDKEDLTQCLAAEILGVEEWHPCAKESECLRPYHVENTRSRPITEVKQRRARLVLGWETAWEYRVL